MKWQGEPCGHSRPLAAAQLHGICIFCWRDRGGAAIAALRERLAEEVARADAAEARAKALEEAGRSVVNALYRRVVHMGAECWRYETTYYAGRDNPVEAFRRLLAGEGTISPPSAKRSAAEGGDDE